MSEEHFRIIDSNEARISHRNVENDPELRAKELQRNRHQMAREIASRLIDVTHNNGRFGPLKSKLMQCMYASVYAAELLEGPKKNS